MFYCDFRSSIAKILNPYNFAYGIKLGQTLAARMHSKVLRRIPTTFNNVSIECVCVFIQ